jgi:hypothetical protein
MYGKPSMVAVELMKFKEENFIPTCTFHRRRQLITIAVFKK